MDVESYHCRERCSLGFLCFPIALEWLESASLACIYFCFSKHTNNLNIYRSFVLQVLYFHFHVIFSRVAPFRLSDEDDSVVFSVADVDLVLVDWRTIFLP